MFGGEGMKNVKSKPKKSPKSKVDKQLTINALEKTFNGDLDLVLFFLAWIKNGRNASKAYLELNPHVDPHSARVLGSKQLAKINIHSILEIYDLGYEDYFKQLREGLQANRKRAEIVDRDSKGQPIYAYFDEPDHKVRNDYHKRLGELLGLEKGGSAFAPNYTENNYYNLTDEQLDQLIQSKLKQTGTADVIEGETTEDITQPA